MRRFFQSPAALGRRTLATEGTQEMKEMKEMGTQMAQMAQIFLSPAERKEIAEGLARRPEGESQMSPSENVVEIIMRS